MLRRGTPDGPAEMMPATRWQASVINTMLVLQSGPVVFGQKPGFCRGFPQTPHHYNGKRHSHPTW